MKARDLSLLLAEEPDRIVVLAEDEEGNAYSPVGGFFPASYVATSTWSGECGSDESPGGQGERAIVLYPLEHNSVKVRAGDLAKALHGHDDRTVILKKRHEGFSPLEEVSTAAYEAYSPSSGQCFLEKLTPELIRKGYTAEDVRDVTLDSVEKVFVLYPVN